MLRPICNIIGDLIRCGAGRIRNLQYPVGWDPAPHRAEGLTGAGRLRDYAAREAEMRTGLIREQAIIIYLYINL
jgi:hypothetical protein